MVMEDDTGRTATWTSASHLNQRLYFICSVLQFLVCLKLVKRFLRLIVYDIYLPFGLHRLPSPRGCCRSRTLARLQFPASWRFHDIC